MRLITPIYGALAGNGQDAELARAIFERLRSKYHPITNSSIEARLRTASEAKAPED
jgi:hypothetical protein